MRDFFLNCLNRLLDFHSEEKESVKVYSLVNWSRATGCPSPYGVEIRYGSVRKHFSEPLVLWSWVVKYPHRSPSQCESCSFGVGQGSKSRALQEDLLVTLIHGHPANINLPASVLCFMVQCHHFGLCNTNLVVLLTNLRILKPRMVWLHPLSFFSRGEKLPLLVCISLNQSHKGCSSCVLQNNVRGELVLQLGRGACTSSVDISNMPSSAAVIFVLSLWRSWYFHGAPCHFSNIYLEVKKHWRSWFVINFTRPIKSSNKRVSLLLYMWTLAACAATLPFCTDIRAAVQTAETLLDFS